MRSCLLLVLTTGLGCALDDHSEPSSRSQAVIGGHKEPASLGFALHPWEQNAVVAQTVKAAGTYHQGCSATLVGDRVVVTAGHCVILNQEQWKKGAQAEVVRPNGNLFYAVGPDANEPLCRLEGESVHVNPKIAVQIGKVPSIVHDVAVTLLKESALKSCPHVVPVQINRDPVPAELAGGSLLQGGFGSLDGTYNFSPVRYWSAIELFEMNDEVVIARDQKKGFPTFGDSGSAALHRFGDGTLRHIGVASSMVKSVDKLALIRLDAEGAFFDAQLTEELLCGDIDAEGICREQVLVTCGKRGFAMRDCAEQPCGTCRCRADCPPPAPRDAGAPPADAAPPTVDASAEPDAPPSDSGGCALTPAETLPAPLAALLGLWLVLWPRRRRLATQR